jgi:hypothetical protein
LGCNPKSVRFKGVNDQDVVVGKEGVEHGAEVVVVLHKGLILMDRKRVFEACDVGSGWMGCE